MNELEKIFDDIGNPHTEEKELYFSELRTRLLDATNVIYERLLFLNEKGFKVYKGEDNDMHFYIDYPCRDLGGSMVTSKVTSVLTPYTYLGETRSFPTPHNGFVVYWDKDMDGIWKCYDTLKELVKAYAEKVKNSYLFGRMK